MVTFGSCEGGCCHKKTFLHDSAPVDLLTHGHDLAYRRETQWFVSGCDANFLKPNVGETEELITDFRENHFRISPPSLSAGKKSVARLLHVRGANEVPSSGSGLKVAFFYFNKLQIMKIYSGNKTISYI